MMKKLIMIILMLTTACMLFAGCSAGKDKKRVEELEAELAQKNEIISGLENELADLKNQLENLSKITYSVKHYFEELDGAFVEDKALSEQKTAVDGELVTADSITKNGFTFDSNNALNKTEATVVKGSVNELAFYYTRNSYAVTVIGGSAEKSTAKFGEQITVTPALGGDPVFTAVGEGATVEGDILTVGSADVTVTVGYKGPIVLNGSEIVDSKNSSFNVQVNVSDITKKHGIVFLYNSIFGKESYYSFTSQDNKVRLYLFDGTEEKLLKTKLNVNVTEGLHTYGIELAKDGTINCLFDGEVMITRQVSAMSNAITQPGQYGAFADADNVSVTSFTVNYGRAKLGTIKQALIDTYSCVELSTYKFDLSTWTIINSVEKIDATTSPYFEMAHELFADIDACQETKDIIDLTKAFDNEYYVNLVREAMSASMHALAQDLVDCLLRPYVGDAEDVINSQSLNATISMDIYDKDSRWYVPGAYKLYSGTEGDSKGIFDFLREELALANTVEEITALGAKYYFDVARNTIGKIAEFYYVWNYENGYPSYNIWWHIYTYCSDNYTFNYYGCVDGYVFPNASGFRLSRIFFDGTWSECVKDTTQLLIMHKWMRENQIVAPGSYNVTFNLNGGTMSGDTTVVVDATNAYALPTPTKEGATFGGWYTSRNFRNGSIGQIAAMNKSDFTLYAKWKEDVAQPTISVADIFTENMVLPRNKPVKVFGSGKDGTIVTVSFKGQTKTATVEDGKWSVTLDAMSATTVGEVLTVSANDVAYKFSNVVVGEVWLCSGQSNMEFRVGWLNLKQIGLYGELDYSKIRIYRQSVPGATDTYDVNSDRWHAFDSRTKAFDVLNFSTVALGFASELQSILGEEIPVGVVESSRGGTLIEEWMNADDIASVGSSVPAANKSIEARYYDGMTELLRGFNFSGVVWYQGCSNADYPELYVEQFKALVSEWREMFENQNLPVVVAQLVQYGLMDFKEFRLMQWDLMKAIDNVYTVSGIDLGLEADIHPHDKLPLAKRMAAVAAKYVYNAVDSSVLSAYPVSVVKDGNTLVISFSDATDGFIPKYVIEGFEVAGTDGKYYACNAEIINGKIVLSGFDFDVVSIRYLYIDYVGEVDLYTSNGLPVAPFVWTV